MAKEKILIVEDSEDYRVALRIMLEPFFAIDQAHTLANGLARLKQRDTTYYAALIDLADSEWRATFPATVNQIPVPAIVIVSQWDEPTFVVNIIRWGAAGYLVKGKDDLDSAHLYRRIKNAVSHARIADKLDAVTEIIIRETDTAIARRSHQHATRS
jgi:DNA-binding NarL/FixJ family response regulator